MYAFMHGAATHGVTSATAIGIQDAERVARLMSALATASRVRILAHLRRAPCSVGELAAAVQMAQPAVSHQLRILRDLGLVVRSQAGRTSVYALHDTHVATLLDEALRHIEHLASAQPEARAYRQQPATQAQITKEESSMTDDHAHQSAHAHEHTHGDTGHNHVHTEHAHQHIEHAHPHSHGSESHDHPHAHQANLQDEHEHAGA